MDCALINLVTTPDAYCVYISSGTIAAAILIAASSNNLLKTGYAIAFAGGRATAGSAVTLIVLAIAGVAAAVAMGGLAQPQS